MNLENRNPTETEKFMFRYLGLYLIYSNEDAMAYAPVHTASKYDEFPISIEAVDIEMIDWKSAVLFDKKSETITIFNSQFYVIDAMILFVKRMEELGFKRCFSFSENKEE